MKILVSDFDRTLFVDNENDFNKNINSINSFINKGNHFVLATGRMYTDISLLINKYNIKYNYLICEDGGKIFNNLGFSLIDNLIPEKVVKEVIKLLDKYNLKYKLDDGYNYTNNVNDCIKISSKITDIKLYKDVLKEIKQLDVYAYLSPHYLNITSSKTSKEKAINYLSRIENYSTNDIYVIGDDINDYEMLQKYNGGLIKKHSKDLDKLNIEEYESLHEFINNIE